MDLEQYMAGCLSFDVNEYFARYVATSSTVRIYTKLLSYYDTNDISINHYAYCYIQRLCSYRLDQPYPVSCKPLKISLLTVSNINIQNDINSNTDTATAVSAEVNNTGKIQKYSTSFFSLFSLSSFFS